MDPIESDERTYHGTLNRLALASFQIAAVTRWCLGYPTTSNMERLNQIIPLSEVEKTEVKRVIVLLEEVVENG